MTTLSPKQSEAVTGCTKRIKDGERVTILDGFAGTGKSTMLPYIIDDLGFDPASVAYMAPTGKAAKVMRQKLRTVYPTVTTSTIHSAIYRAKPAPVGQLEGELFTHQCDLQAYREQGGDDPAKIEHHRKAIMRLEMELDNVYRDDKLHFNLNVDSAISLASLIVMDERSMANTQIADDLMYFGVPILAIGDPGQLPPVEGDIGFGKKAHFFLEEIHRQAADNPIIHVATLARQGKEIPIGKYGDTVEVMRSRDYQHDYQADNQPKVLVGMNKTRWKITQMIRAERGIIEDELHILGPQPAEPLIICKNLREFPQLVNGTECIATSQGILEKGRTVMKMSFEDDDGVAYNDKNVFQGLFEEHYSKVPGQYSSDKRMAYKAKKSAIQADWAWAITVHKSQGSQYDHVVLKDESGVFRQDADKHLYTGITRAAETLKILV